MTNARNLANRSTDFVSVRDFGARGDGVTDDTAAIQAAIDYAIGASKAVYIPAGTYRVNSTVYLPDQTSHPNQTVIIIGEGSNKWLDGTRNGAVIYSYATSLFKSKTTPTIGSALKSVKLLMSGVELYASYSANPSAICFDKLNILAGDIYNCEFYGFDRVISGSMNGVTQFHHNQVGARIFLYPEAAYTSVSADSTISHNYINGLGGTSAGMTTTPLISLADTGQMTLVHNYIDFTYIAVTVGGGGQNVIVSHNTIDLSFVGVQMKFGVGSALIDGNNFFNFNKTKVSMFPSPIAAMVTDDWTCIKAQNESVANKQITNNRYEVADVFLYLASKGNWNITESGNVGKYPNSASGLPVSAVNFGTRTIDTATYPLDNQYIDLASVKDKLQTDIQTKRATYWGMTYFIGSPPVRVRANNDWSLSDMNGSYLWGKTNQLAATDFSTGWTFASGVSQVAGVFTASSGNGWSYYTAALPAGTYVICLNIATLSGAGVYVEIGHSLAATPTTYVTGSSSNLASSPGAVTNTVGRMFAKLTPSGTTARIAIYVPAGTNCTIDYVHLIRIA